MATNPHWFSSFRGTLGELGSTDETWSFGLHWGSPNIVWDQAKNDALRAAWATTHANNELQVSSAAKFREVRTYNLGVDGKALDVPIISSGPGVSGGTSSNHHPWQNSLVISFRSEGLGKGRRGRIYLPPSASAIDPSNGLISATLAAGVANAFRAFLVAARGITAPEAGPLIAINGTTGAQGTLHLVDEIRVGRVIDTQRRRRRQLREEYHVLPVGAL